MYKGILGPDSASDNIALRCILAVPRSGSTFVHIFFQVYSRLLNKEPITDQNLFYQGSEDISVNGAHIITNHCECPGFRDIVDPENFTKWDALCNSEPISNLLGDPPKEFTSDYPRSPVFLRSKMVFLFRNPLDQLLSLFVYFNRNDNRDTYKSDLEIFIRDGHFIDWFIKVLYPFHVVRRQRPDMFLFVPYEQLMADKPNVLRRMLTHLGLPFDQTAFTTALELTRIEALQAVETRLGRGLRGGERQKHIRSGKTGLWQNYMSLELVQYIEERLNRFGLSLKMFTLAEELEPQFAFLADPLPAPAPVAFRLGMP